MIIENCFKDYKPKITSLQLLTVAIYLKWQGITLWQIMELSLANKLEQTEKAQMSLKQIRLLLATIV